MATKKIIDLEGLKVYDKEYVQPLEKKAQVLELRVKSLEYQGSGKIGDDNILQGSAKSVAIPSATAPSGIIMELGGNIEKDDTLTSRAGVVGNTKKYNQIQAVSSYNGSVSAWQNILQHIGLNQNHKYFVSFVVKNNDTVYRWCIGDPNNQPNTRTLHISSNGVYQRIVNCDEGGTNARCWFTHWSGTATYDISNYMLVDLTDMYGAGNEPTSVEQFLTDYPQYNGYVPYTETTLSSPKFTEMSLVGENIWNEQWELGTISISSGRNVSSSTNIRSKDYINILPNTIYSTNQTTTLYCFYYDENKEFLNTIGQTAVSGRFTTPNNARYMRFRLSSSYGSTYNNDIAIVRGTSGTYKPYNAQTLTLAEQTLNGQDEIYSYVEGNELVVKKITRYTELLLTRSLLANCSTYGTNQEFMLLNFSTLGITNIKTIVRTEKPNVYASKLTTYTYNELTDGTKDLGIAIHYDGQSFRVLNRSCTNLDQHIAYLENSKLVYELATQTITEIARVPLTCDFKQIENVITNNVEFATETQNIQKGVVVASMTEKVETIGENLIKNLSELTPCFIPKNTDFYISTKNGDKSISISFYDKNRNYIDYFATQNRTPANGRQLNLNYDIYFMSVSNADIEDAAFVSFKSNTSYKPYREPQTYLLSQLVQIKERVGDITLGYIDFDRKVFVVDKFIIDKNSNWQYSSPNAIYIYSTLMPSFSNSTGHLLLNANYDCFAWNDRNGKNNYISPTSTYIWYFNTDFKNLNDLKEYTKDIHIVVPLATPQEIDISDILDDEDKFVEIEENGTIEFTEKTAYKVLTQVKVA